MSRNLIVLALLTFAGAASATTLIMPPLAPQGHYCGGVIKTVTVVGFDANDNVQAIIVGKTTCSTGGRGARPATFVQSFNITWDNAGAYTLNFPAKLTVPGNVDPHGNAVNVVNNSTYVTKVTLNEISATPYVPVAAFVPNEKGKDITTAAADVTALGLVPYIFNSTAASCVTYPYVCGQTPNSGAVAQFGSTVTLMTGYLPSPDSGDSGVND